MSNEKDQRPMPHFQDYIRDMIIQKRDEQCDMYASTNANKMVVKQIADPASLSANDLLEMWSNEYDHFEFMFMAENEHLYQI